MLTEISLQDGTMPNFFMQQDCSVEGSIHNVANRFALFNSSSVFNLGQERSPYIEVMAEPEQETPIQAAPQGSPPPAADQPTS